jgi:hypothetical protein
LEEAKRLKLLKFKGIYEKSPDKIEAFCDPAGSGNYL